MHIVYSAHWCTISLPDRQLALNAAIVHPGLEEASPFSSFFGKTTISGFIPMLQVTGLIIKDNGEAFQQLEMLNIDL